MKPILLIPLAAATLASSQAAILLQDAIAYTQDFNTLANTGTSSSLPADWAIFETGSSTAVDGEYAAGTGSANGGNIYSFGAAGDPDRALGSLSSGALAPLFGAGFTIVDAGLTQVQIGYTGELWRRGAADRSDRLAFQYSLDATSLTDGTWADFAALDFSSPTGPTAGALDGNTNRTTVTGTINLGTTAANQSLWIRWNDTDASGADDGLGVDSFSITANSVPEPSTALFGGLGLLALLRRRRA